MSSPNLDQLPDALSTHVGYLLVRLGKHAQRLFSSRVEAFGLRPPHCDILFTLHERGALSQIEIANTLTIERAHLVGLIDQLETLGFVRREADPNDRRRHSVCLSEQGKQTATKISKIAKNVEGQILEGLSEQEQGKLRATLRRLAEAADEGD